MLVSEVTWEILKTKKALKLAWRKASGLKHFSNISNHIKQDTYCAPHAYEKKKATIAVSNYAYKADYKYVKRPAWWS